MSRLGITYDEVADAARSIETNGETPTIDKIRSFLGETGSNTTISKYLNMWRRQTLPLSKDKENKVETPDIVKAAVDRVWQDMREQTDSEIEAIKSEAQRLVEDAEKKTQSAETNFNVLKSEHDQLQELHQAQRAEKELLLLDVKNLREEQALLRERFKALGGKVRKLRFAATLEILFGVLLKILHFRPIRIC